MLDDTPQTRVVLADQAGGSGHRHSLDESHDERFEQKREAGSRPCPRHVDEAHATVGTVDAGDARVQERLVLKEIEVAPGLLYRVVHRAVGLAALGTGKPATGLEVDLDIEPLLVGVELGVHHHPRRHQAECELEQIDVAHGALSSRLARRHRAAVLVAVKNKPLRARDPRAFLTATRHVGGYSVRPGRKDGSAGPNKRMGPKRRKPLFEVPGHPFMSARRLKVVHDYAQAPESRCVRFGEEFSSAPGMNVGRSDTEELSMDTQKSPVIERPIPIATTRILWIAVLGLVAYFWIAVVLVSNAHEEERPLRCCGTCAPGFGDPATGIEWTADASAGVAKAARA